jgi:hypothetical protein
VAGVCFVPYDLAELVGSPSNAITVQSFTDRPGRSGLAAKGPITVAVDVEQHRHDYTYSQLIQRQQTSLPRPAMDGAARSGEGVPPAQWAASAVPTVSDRRRALHYPTAGVMCDGAYPDAALRYGQKVRSPLVLRNERPGLSSHTGPALSAKGWPRD